VQLVVLAVPIAAAVGCAALVSSALPHAHRLGPALGWWIVVVACSTVTLYAVDRVARRLLPLALLLRLSLVFPDQAPRRFRLAARSWSSRRLRNELTRQGASDASSAPAEAAAQLVGLLAGLAAHDPRTRGHCERVRAYNDLLAEELGLSEADRDRLRWAALIHDIGKIKVSRRVLNKPGALTDREWEQIRQHPIRGAEIAAPLAEWLGPWSLAIAQHHEHWDGTGYPQGLAGTDISLGARIVGVADAFEVMTSPRPYRKPMDAAAAREELASCAGTHFDPHVVRALLNVSLGRLRRAMGPIAWFAQVPLLAAMPQLGAALITGGQAASAGGAIGVVAVASVAAAGHAQVHEVAQHPQPPVVERSVGAVDPLAGLLEAGRNPRTTVVQSGGHASHHARHGKSRLHHGLGTKHRNAHAQAQSHAHLSGVNPTASSAPGQQVAATKRHHGQNHRASSTLAAAKGRCVPNSGADLRSPGKIRHCVKTNR
jgi:putative nucleotidyltransferase with HDIG domain